MNKYAYQLHIEQENHKFHNPINMISFTKKSKTLQKKNFHNPINVISSAKREKPYKITTFTTPPPMTTRSLSLYIYPPDADFVDPYIPRSQPTEGG